MSDFTDHYFDFDDITLHYVEAGSGPLVIFYHGFPLFWFSFHHQMTALKDHYRVVAVDGLGVNLSSKPTDLEKYKLENLAAQLNALANHLAPGKPFSLVGHDWGGALAWSFAQAYPDRLKKVIGINAPPTNQLLHLLQTNEEQRKRSSYMWLMRGGKTHTLITENGARRLWKNAYAKFRDLPHFTKAHDETFREALAVPGAVDGGVGRIPGLLEVVDHVAAIGGAGGPVGPGVVGGGLALFDAADRGGPWSHRCTSDAIPSRPVHLEGKAASMTAVPSLHNR